MPQQPVLVQWRVALDERMRRVVRKGAVFAWPELAHSVHVEVGGLQPSRWYWYQFRIGNDESPLGRTRTAPPAFARPGTARFAFASCQNYAQGFYPAYRRMAEENLDFAVHLGDYIYENPAGAEVRLHLPANETYTLNDYRIRHAQYKTDAALQAAHAACPWIVTWDDHDTDNNYAGLLPEIPSEEPDFPARRAHAYQAYYEHMPLRLRQMPRGPYLSLFRRLNFGTLAEINVLDTRQYRSAREASCAPGELLDGYCPEALDPNRTMAGFAQRDWLIRGLDSSTASWNVLANQVLFSPFDSDPDPAQRAFPGESWNAFPYERARILDLITARKLYNTVVITGDVHVNVALNVPPDSINLDAEPVATEFVGTSISSGGDRTLFTNFGGDANNPHLRFINSHHGYALCTLTPALWRTDYRVVPSVLVQDAPISTVASFVVEQGQAGAVRA